MPLFAPTPWHAVLLGALVEFFTIEIMVASAATVLLMSAMVYGPLLVVKAPLIGAALLWQYVRSFRNPFRFFIVVGKTVDEFESGCASKSVAEMAAYNTKQLEEEQKRRPYQRGEPGAWVDGPVDAIDGQQQQQAAQPEASGLIPNGALASAAAQPAAASPAAGLYARLAGRGTR